MDWKNLRMWGGLGALVVGLGFGLGWFNPEEPRKQVELPPAHEIVEPVVLDKTSPKLELDEIVEPIQEVEIEKLTDEDLPEETQVSEQVIQDNDLIIPAFDPSLASTDSGLYTMLMRGNPADVFNILRNVDYDKNIDPTQSLVEGDYDTAFLELLRAMRFRDAAAVGEALGITHENLEILMMGMGWIVEDGIPIDRFTRSENLLREQLRNRRIKLLLDLEKEHPEVTQTIVMDLPNFGGEQVARIIFGIKADDPNFEDYRARTNAIIREEGPAAFANEDPFHIDYNEILDKSNYLAVMRAKINYSVESREPRFGIMSLGQIIEELRGTEYEEAHTLADQSTSHFRSMARRLLESGEDIDLAYDEIVRDPTISRNIPLENRRTIVEAYASRVPKTIAYMIKQAEGELDTFRKSMIVRMRLKVVEAYLLVEMQAQAQEVLEKVYDTPLDYFVLSSSKRIPEIVSRQFPELAPELNSRHVTAHQEWVEQLERENN